MSEEPAAPRSTGVVKWFHSRKGFGFITPDDGEDDVFVHQSSIRVEGFRSLAEGAKVEYTAVDGPDGRMKAINVTGPGGSRPKVGVRVNVHQQARMPSYSMPQPSVQYGAGAYMYPYGPMAYHTGPWPAGFMPAPHGMHGMPAYPTAPAAQTYYMPGMMMQQQHGMGSPGIGSSGVGSAMSGMTSPQHLAQMSGMVSPQPGGPGSPPGPFRVVVHNISWATTSEELESAFVRWNPELAEVITDAAGQSRGYGVVSFPTQQDMETAMSEMHGSDLGGRRISVRPDRFT